MTSISNAERTMTLWRVDDWRALNNIHVEIRLGARILCYGLVDAVTADGTVLWVNPAGEERRLYEKSDAFEAWVDAEHSIHLELGRKLGKRQEKEV